MTHNVFVVILFFWNLDRKKKNNIHTWTSHCHPVAAPYWIFGKLPPKNSFPLRQQETARPHLLLKVIMWCDFEPKILNHNKKTTASISDF